jgi:hypothetical protein
VPNRTHRRFRETARLGNRQLHIAPTILMRTHQVACSTSATHPPRDNMSTRCMPSRR